MTVGSIIEQTNLTLGFPIGVEPCVPGSAPEAIETRELGDWNRAQRREFLPARSGQVLPPAARAGAAETFPVLSFPDERRKTRQILLFGFFEVFDDDDGVAGFLDERLALSRTLDVVVF